MINNSGQEIILFSNDVTQDEGGIFEPDAFKKNAAPSGITFPYYYMTLPHGYTHTFVHVNQIPEKIVYFEYKVVDEKYSLTKKKEIFAKDFAGYNYQADTVSNTTKTESKVVTQKTQNVPRKTKQNEPEKPVTEQITEPVPVVSSDELEKDTLTYFEDIDECENEPDHINISYTALALIGVVLLLLILVSSPQVAAVTIASMMVFPLLYENFYTAIGQTDKDLLQMAKVHKIPFIKQLSGIYILHMSPYVFGSGAAGISMGLKVVVAAEIITIPLGSTLGTAMDGASRVGSVELLFAWLLIAVLLCFVLEGVIKLAGWALMPWRRVKNG
jgi:hypothetical protein